MQTVELEFDLKKYIQRYTSWSPLHAAVITVLHNSGVVKHSHVHVFGQHQGSFGEAFAPPHPLGTHVATVFGMH